MLIPVKNNLADNAPVTHLTHNEVSGTNVIRWKNANGFNASWAVQIGETGEEQTEIKLLGTSTPAGTAGTLTANTDFEHPADTPVYAIKYDQIIFLRSTDGTAGTATAMTDGTINIQPDNDVTEFDDTSGSSTYAYRSRFRNSVLGVNTILSDWITSTGFDFYSLAKIRERIQSKLWSADFVKPAEIDDWINEWVEKMRNAAISVNEDFALGTVDVAFGTSGLGTITQTDFKGKLRRVWITYNGDDFYRAKKMDIREYLPNQTFNSTHPYFAMQGENIILVKPEENGGTARLVYPTLATILSNDTDILPVSMRGYTKSFIDYGLAQAYLKDNKPADAEARENRAMVELERFKTEISPRNQTGVTYIELVESVGGEDDWLF